METHASIFKAKVVVFKFLDITCGNSGVVIVALIMLGSILARIFI
jgi:hypothetical protein